MTQRPKANGGAQAGMMLGVAVLVGALLAPLAASAQTGLTTLHSFTGGVDGAIIYKGPTLDAAGNLYGNSFYGANACPDSYLYANVGCGIVWKLAPGGTLTPLVTFTGAANGADPDGNLTLANKLLYGATFTGGAMNQGTVFQVSGIGKNFRTLYSFSGLDGEHPDSFPRLDSQGNIFSVTSYGGPAYNGTDDSGFGVLFEITSTGQFISQHPFSGGADGGTPQRIFLDSSGTIFGATTIGGSCSGQGLPAAGCGTLYSFVPSTGQFTTIYTFTGLADGYDAFIAGISGSQIYGATAGGGAHGYGTLFKVKPNGSGGYTYVHLYDFTGGSDGAYPNEPTLKGTNELIGTTQEGPVVGNNLGAGVLFDFKAGTLKTLYTFVNDAHGGYPYGTPVLAKNGTIYGTTAYGGVVPCNTTGGTLISSYGCGTIYHYVP